jgi:hypothetical protein
MRVAIREPLLMASPSALRLFDLTRRLGGPTETTSKWARLPRQKIRAPRLDQSEKVILTALAALLTRRHSLLTCCQRHARQQ